SSNDALAKTNSAIGEVAVINEKTKKLNLDSSIEVLVDKRNEYELTDIIAGEYDDEFVYYHGKGRPNFGYSSAAHWVRFEVMNESDHDDWLLEFDAPKTNQVNFYL